MRYASATLPMLCFPFRLVCADEQALAFMGWFFFVTFTNTLHFCFVCERSPGSDFGDDMNRWRIYLRGSLNETALYHYQCIFLVRQLS